MSTPSRERAVVRHELVRRELEVVRVERLTSTIVRVTLGGDDVVGFSAPGPEDHVKVFLETAGGEPARRDYTPRAHRPDVGELDIDFVTHGATGPAGAWAASAAPGQRLAIGGPRGSRLAPGGYERFVLLADESAVPALSRWIEAIGTTAHVEAFVQSDSPDIAEYPFPDTATVAVVPTGAEAGVAAVRDAAPDADTYVWAAGEATSLIPVRRFLRRDLGIDRADMKVDGYWRRGVAGADHHAPLDPSEPDDCSRRRSKSCRRGSATAPPRQPPRDGYGGPSASSRSAPQSPR
jgi:NADPH-dependent ferric siderophore reductase